jgi:HAD superfamily hydrolase (TIGR01450 family)
MIHPQFDEPVGGARGVMFDLDGTLILSNRDLGEYRVLPGAIETLAKLKDLGVPFLALTNGSAYPAARQAPRLRALGLPIADSELFTPNSVASHVFQKHGIQKVMVLGTEGVIQALQEDDINTCLAGETGSDDADAVYVAWHPGCTMEHIHAAAEAVLNGARFYTASDVPFFATQSGRSFGYSCAISGAIVRVTGKEPEVTGKPSLHAMQFIATRLGVATAEVLVVGDDPKVETEMARIGGAIGVGVTTGTTDLTGWSQAKIDCRPHRVIDQVSEILNLGILT